MSCVVLATKGKSLPVLIAHKALAWSLMSMSCSFIVPITMSDMYTGNELGIRNVQLFGSMGASLIFSPPLGSFVMSRGGSMAVFKLRLAVAVLQLWYIRKFVPETLTSERRVPFKASDINPFSFLRLFTKSRPLRVLVTALFFHCCVEGKNLASLRSSWTNGPPLSWPVQKQSVVTTIYGVLGFISGKYLAPKLMRGLGARRFTSTTNILNVIGLSTTGIQIGDYDTSLWLGMLLQMPGQNNTSAASIKALATDHAIANGFGRGEYGGMYSSIRTFSMILAPLIFGWTYQKGGASRPLEARGFAGLPWLLAAFLGGAVPELLHRSLSDDELLRAK